MITVVTGVPRSGTSLTMKMLDDSGIPAYFDGQTHQEINPYGSFETNVPIFDLSLYDGQCVKCFQVISIFDTPPSNYKIIMPYRDPEQIILSRIEAFKIKNRTDASIDKQISQISRQYRFLRFIIANRPDMQLLEIPYTDYFQKTSEVVDMISDFVGGIDKAKASAAVDPTYFKIRTRAEVLTQGEPING